MSGQALPTLVGQLRVRTGGAWPRITSTRRELAPQLARGLPAARWPGRAAQAFALCGGAHRIAARHAVRAAGATVDDDPDPGALRVDTLREHLRRLWLDLPRALPGGAMPDATALAGCALLRRPQALHDSLAWFDAQVFGQPVADWLAGWRCDAATHAARWAARGATTPARVLATVRQQLGACTLPVVPLLPHAAAPGLRRLGAQLLGQQGFALAPVWQGRSAETGCWTRLAEHRSAPPGSRDDPLWMRHAARLADIARLLAPDAGPALSQGALALGDGQGLGWCEMARGLLLHAVRLDGDGRVADARTLAPTEWNFHPCGPAARALAQLPAHASPGLVVAAYDPCVEVHLEVDVEAEHA